MACPGQAPFGEYHEDYIRTIRGPEHVRLNPGMYIGSIDAEGLFNLLFEFVTPALAETVAGYGRSVRVALCTDGSAEVADDGRTLPSCNPPVGMPTVEQAFTEFGVGSRGSLDPYQLARHDWGYVFANALSERLTVFVRNDNSVYQHAFRRGITHSAVQSGGSPNDRGLTVRFLPDPLIFGDARFDAGAIRARLRQLAFLHSGVRITFTDEVAGTHDEFEYADGIRECVQFLNADRAPLHPEVILLRGEEEGVRYEVGLQWCVSEDSIRMSFANHQRTQYGGTHDSGLAAGVALGVRDWMRDSAPQPGEFNSEDFREGLTAVVSVWLPDPWFEGSTRSRLGNPEVEHIVNIVARRGVRDYFAANPNLAANVVRAVVAARDARIAAAAARRKK